MSKSEAYVVVNSCDNDRSNHEKPVRKRNVHLPMKDLRCMDHLDLRKIGQFHNL